MQAFQEESEVESVLESHATTDDQFSPHAEPKDISAKESDSESTFTSQESKEFSDKETEVIESVASSLKTLNFGSGLPPLLPLPQLPSPPQRAQSWHDFLATPPSKAPSTAILPTPAIPPPLLPTPTSRKPGLLPSPPHQGTLLSRHQHSLQDPLFRGRSSELAMRGSASNLSLSIQQ